MFGKKTSYIEKEGHNRDKKNSIMKWRRNQKRTCGCLLCLFLFILVSTIYSREDTSHGRENHKIEESNQSNSVNKNVDLSKEENRKVNQNDNVKVVDEKNVMLNQLEQSNNLFYVKGYQWNRKDTLDFTFTFDKEFVDKEVTIFLSNYRTKENVVLLKDTVKQVITKNYKVLESGIYQIYIFVDSEDVTDLVDINYSIYSQIETIEDGNEHGGIILLDNDK